MGDRSEEWTFNNWNSSNTGGQDPLGPSGMDPNSHSQKTRRDVPAGITGRLIRSVDGVGPRLRLVISATSAYPPGMNSPCDFHAPELEGEPVNSYRDPRWVTEGDYVWGAGPNPGVNLGLNLWSDGTARRAGSYGGSATNGQWFTSNNIALVFVPTSGSPTVYMYIFLDETQGSIVSDQGLMVYGRFKKNPATNVTKPNVTLAASAEALARAQPDFATRFKMVDMVNMPQSARGQDRALLDGTSSAWWQDNVGKGYGGTHRYRKDIDLDVFRFIVYEGTSGDGTNLAFGDWFTINNMFLRVTDNRTNNPYVCDYLYAISGSGNSRILFHNSFQDYERADTRGLDFTASNSSVTNYAREIPKTLSRSMYAPGGYMGNIGHSTFTPAPCPAGGCN